MKIIPAPITNRVNEIFERMTVREKMLLGILTGAVVLAGIIVVIVQSNSALESTQREIADLERSIRVVHENASKYQSAQLQEKLFRDAVERNTVSNLSTTIDTIAKRVRITDQDSPGTGGSLNDVLEYPGEAENKRRPLKFPQTKKGKKIKKKDLDKLKPGSFIVRVNQEVKLDDPVSHQTIFDFLALLEQSEKLQQLNKARDYSQVMKDWKLLFVTYLEINEKFGRPDVAKIERMVVTTYIQPCGNGKVEGDEECDDGRIGSSECTPKCTKRKKKKS
ncbi:MAG: hypothetical protein CMH54_13070 [Myxococcales bacterium]|nr:hypothetical protein [Myxococcales bacterium]